MSFFGRLNGPEISFLIVSSSCAHIGSRREINSLNGNYSSEFSWTLSRGDLRSSRLLVFAFVEYCASYSYDSNYGANSHVQYGGVLVPCSRYSHRAVHWDGCGLG